MALGKAQAVADLGLYLPKGPRTDKHSGQLQSTLEDDPTTSTKDTLKRQIQQTPEAPNINSAL